PNEAGESESNKQRTPSVASYQQATNEDPQTGAQHLPRDDGRVRQASVMLRDTARYDLGIRRESDGLSQAQEQSQSEEQREGVRGGGETGRGGPDDKSNGQQPVDVETIDHPAGE